MLAVRFHGRGGQGAVVASRILAEALFREGWEVQAFPSFGAERSGAPVAAFLRADHRPIHLRCHVTAPDHVVVLDPLLVDAVDVTAGLVRGGSILVNAVRRPERLAGVDAHVFVCDATAIARRHGLGSRTHPIVNTAIVGAWAAMSGLVALDDLLEVIAAHVPRGREANQAAAREAFDAMRSSITPHAEVGVA